MIVDESAAVLPMWMLLSAGFGFVLGELCGDYRRHQICLQEENEELRQRLEQAADNKPIERVLKEQRSVINDIHRRLHKLAANTRSKPNE